MKAQARSVSPYEMQRLAWGALMLISSGAFASLGLVLIASNRLPFISPPVGTFTLLFLQWQMLALTITKIGIGEVVFAVVSKDNQLYFDARRFLAGKPLLLAALLAVAIGYMFTPLAGLVAFACLLLDTCSTIFIADLNANNRFAATSIAGLLNYPVFFLALLACSWVAHVSTQFMLLAFLLSSVTRWLWLRQQVSCAGREAVICRANWEMAGQQALNYLMFRLDQLVLGSVALTSVFMLHNQEYIRQFVFLAKFPEILSSVLVTLGAILLPRLHLTSPQAIRWRHAPFLQVIIVLGYAASLYILLSLYLDFWHGPPLTEVSVFPFLVQALCILPVNLLTYSMIREGHLHGLLRNLYASIGLGLLVFFGIGWVTRSYPLAWLVPIQLLAFLAQGKLLSWGHQKTVYDVL